MFCPFCGTQIPDDSKFCSGCGSRVDFDENEQEYMQEIPLMPEMPEDPYGKKPGKGKFIVIIILLIAVLAGAGIGGFLFWNHLQDAKEEEEEREAELAEAEEEESGDSKATKSGSAKKEDADKADDDTDSDAGKEKDTKDTAKTENSDKDATETPDKDADKKNSKEADEKNVEAKYDSAEGGIHRYEYIVADRTWEQAYAECISKGGYMVRINSQEEYNYILNEINQKQLGKIQFFIGGRRQSGSQEYYWVDETGKPYGDQINTSSYWCASEWLSGEPSYMDGSIEEMYLDILYHEGSGKWVWNDAPNDIISIVPTFSGKIGYICEYED